MAFVVISGVILTILFLILSVYYAVKKNNKDAKFYVVLAAICIAIVFVAGIINGDFSKEYQIIGTHTLGQRVNSSLFNDVLVVEVNTNAMGEIESIAKDITKKYKNDYRMIRVFFYLPGHEPGQSKPEHRITWTPKEGFKQDY